MAITPEDFGQSFKGFMEQMQAQKSPEEAPFFVRKLREHFGVALTALPVVAESFPPYDHPNVHLSIEHFLTLPGRSAESLGVNSAQAFRSITLAELTSESGGLGSASKEGPIRYKNFTIGNDRVIACVEHALFLIKDGDHRLAVYLRESDRITGNEEIILETMSNERTTAERFLQEIRETIRTRSVYRGNLISLSQEGYREVKVNFHRFPKIERDAIILPAGLLEQIERQTIEFARHSKRLKHAGRHLKRGVLLHGSPGTGKTMTVMHLAAAMSDRTTLLMTGKNLGLIGRTCAMARALQPSIVVLEDVDLIAEERTKGGSGSASPLLFELLNEMDGLSDDVDILFMLTTNHPNLLEPALASRPGRIDQAIEVPLPDESCRKQLFTLYAKGLTLDIKDMTRFITRTDGASPAFIRELLRRASLFAASESDEGDIIVQEHHLENALHELVIRGGELTKSFLGFKSRIGFSSAIQENGSD